MPVRVMIRPAAHPSRAAVITKFVTALGSSNLMEYVTGKKREGSGYPGFVQDFNFWKQAVIWKQLQPTTLYNDN